MLGASIPILQAPIGGSATPELAAAVANAGAIGGLALTGWSNAEAESLISRTRSLTDGLFFVNLLLAFEPECLPTILDSEAPIVTFSFGDASGLIEAAKAKGKMCGVQIGNLEGARRAAGQGADFVIIQGVEAGGHVQSTQPLFALLETVAGAGLGVPLVAAGGIASAAQIRSALDTGADAVMMGTRFVATLESRAHEHYKRRLLAATAADTSLTVCFMDGWPNSLHRVLRNATLEEWEAAGCPLPGGRPREGEVVARTADGEQITRYHMNQPLAGFTGDVEAQALYAGTGCTEIQDVPAAGELVERLWREVGATPFLSADT